MFLQSYYNDGRTGNEMHKAVYNWNSRIADINNHNNLSWRRTNTVEIPQAVAIRHRVTLLRDWWMIQTLTNIE